MSSGRARWVSTHMQTLLGVWEQAGSPQDPLEAAAAVRGQQLLPPRVDELLSVGQQCLARWEEARAEPQQLPAPLLAVSGGGSTHQPRKGPVRGSGQLGTLGRWGQGSLLPSVLMPQKGFTRIKWGRGTIVPISGRSALELGESMNIGKRV